MSDSASVTILKLASIGGLVFANAFFVAAEFALVAVRRSRITTLAESGNQRAKVVLRLMGNLTAVISASQFGITLASLALGWIGEATFAHMLEPLFAAVMPSVVVAAISAHAVAVAFAFVIITFLHIVLGEFVPKAVALERAEQVALSVARPVELFYATFRPFIWILNTSGILVVKPFGLKGDAEHQAAYTEEEIRQLVSLSHQSGHLNADERELIHNVLHFTGSVVREVMLPRQSVVGIDVSKGLRETMEVFEESGYSRLTVHENQPDNIIGIVHSKDILSFALQNKPFSLREILRKPIFIPDTAHLEEAMRQLRNSKTQMAVVVNEHGSVEGIVTLEDLLEEIVGEIQDEHDIEGDEAVFWKQPDGTILLDGRISIREANRKLDLNLPESDDYTTLAGFLMTEAGKLLSARDVVEHQGAVFTVETVEGRRVTRVRLHPARSQSPDIAARSGTA